MKKMNNNLKKVMLTCAVVSTLITSAVPVFAGAHNKGDGGNSGFDFEIESNDVTEYTINLTNTHTTEVCVVKGTKTWVDDDNKDGLRPSEITVHLYADGKDTGESYILSESTNWEYKFTDLAKYDGGELITYSIKEDVPQGYVVTYEKK